MRIVLLNDRIPPENRGGAGIVVWRLAFALSDAGHDVHIIAATEKAPFDEVREGIPTYHLHVRYPERWRAWLSLYNPQVAKPLKSLLQRLAPDVVHAHNIHQDLTYHALHLARLYAKRLLFTSHDTMPITYGKLTHYVRESACLSDASEYRIPFGANLRRARFRYNPFRQHFIKRALAICDARIAVSQALADAHQANGLPRFDVVHNGIAPDAMYVSPDDVQALRQRLQLNDEPIALIAGRLNREKGLFPALYAFAQVHKKMPNARLLILSNQDLGTQISALLKNDLGDAVRVTGWLSGNELRAAFQLARVVLVPSIYLDPLPTVNLEAMSAQKPVIATCHGGSPELVVHQETGYVVNPHDTTTFAHHLAELLGDEAHAQQMGQAGKARLIANFTMQHQLNALLSFYRH
jgi:glycosyltransferase involved in cell wall biosynthesis